jgi:hypothetical protein
LRHRIAGTVDAINRPSAGHSKQFPEIRCNSMSFPVMPALSRGMKNEWKDKAAKNWRLDGSQGLWRMVGQWCLTFRS